MLASVMSVHGFNIEDEVLACQKEVVETFLPEGWEFTQYFYENRNRFFHSRALEQAVKSSKNDIVVLLDIDCIPLSEKALTFLGEKAAEWNGLGLVGAIQRSNHIDNNRHLYVGPFCMAFSKKHYEELGSPSFEETTRGDVGEELTYRWTEKSGSACQIGRNPHRYSSHIRFIWPMVVEQPMWDLDLGFNFGLGTTYGAAGLGKMFYHAFNARNPEMQKVFIERCKQIQKKEKAA